MRWSASLKSERTNFYARAQLLTFWGLKMYMTTWFVLVLGLKLGSISMYVCIDRMTLVVLLLTFRHKIVGSSTTTDYQCQLFASLARWEKAIDPTFPLPLWLAKRKSTTECWANWNWCLLDYFHFWLSFLPIFCFTQLSQIKSTQIS
jgi:hypothetical protein